MKTEKIIEGINNANCRHELSAHMDLIDEAILSDACDFGEREWLKIAACVDAKTQEFNNRIFH